MTSGGDETRDGEGKGAGLPTARDTVAAERKPTPVRTLVSPEASVDQGEPDVEEVCFTADGQEWIARVMGRGGTIAPLILLGFWPADAADGDPSCETYRPGTTLAGLDEDALGELLAVARPRVIEHRRGGERGGAGGKAHRGSPRPGRGNDARSR